MPPAASLPYKVLCQTRPADVCDPDDPGYLTDVWSELDDLYRGGYAIEKNASRYLPQLVGEHAVRYRDRVRSAGYMNYLGEIVDYFRCALFGAQVSVTEASDADDASTPGEPIADRGFWDAFATNADLRGSSLTKLLQDAFTSAALKRKALVAVDFRRMPETAPETRADEERMGLDRAYAFVVPVEQLVDWEHDEDDATVVRVGPDLEVCTYGFSFAVLRKVVRRRAGPEADRSMRIEEFRVWRRDETGAVRWDLYRTAPLKDGEKPGADEPIPWVDGDVTTFDRIPLLELSVPDGLWIGNKIGPLAREHYQRRTTLVAAENRSLVAIPVAALGPEIPAQGGALPSEAQQNPNRGDDPVGRFTAQGYAVTGSDDKIYFAEPSGRAYALVSSELSQLRDEMHRVVHQMANAVDNSAGSQKRSGESKLQDRVAETVILTGYGALLRGFVRRLYETISRARGEDVVWTVHGLDSFDDDGDRATLLDEAVQVDAVSIPSPTFKRAYKLRLALQLLGNVEPETQKTIKDEIDKGVTAEETLATQMRAMLPMQSQEPDGDEGDEPDGDEEDAHDDAQKPARGVGQAPAAP